MQYWRFLHNDAVTVEEIAATARVRTAELVAGRDILVVQDSSGFCFGGFEARERGFGRLRSGSPESGFVLHAALCVDASGDEVLGLVDLQIFNRIGAPPAFRKTRSTKDKESQRWLDGMMHASQALHTAHRITVVADRESDIYEEIATRPSNVHLVTRAAQNRRIIPEGKEERTTLFVHADQCPERARIKVTIPATPGRAPREAHLALRFSNVRICRPRQGSDPSLPDTVSMVQLDVREVKVAKGVTPVHWRLLTSHQISSVETALMVIDFYRKRWIIEEYFRTMKTAGFNVEGCEIQTVPAMKRFTSAAAVAAVTIMQLVRARNGGTKLRIADVFEQGDQMLLEKLNRSLEGETDKQKNPFAKGTLSFASWTIARQGGWDGYYGKPGPKIMRIGLQEFLLIKHGHILGSKNV